MVFIGNFMNIHVDNESDAINGTHLQGHKSVSYHTLCELFGKPCNGDGYKTDAEWVIIAKKTDGSDVVATIYNWKNGYNYLAESGMALHEITQWNIGGFNADSVKLLESLISNNVKLVEETKK